MKLIWTVDKVIVSLKTISDIREDSFVHLMNLPPFQFLDKVEEKILGILMVVGLFGKALLELRPKAETEGGPCRAMFVQLG